MVYKVLLDLTSTLTVDRSFYTSKKYVYICRCVSYPCNIVNNAKFQQLKRASLEYIIVSMYQELKATAAYLVRAVGLLWHGSIQCWRLSFEDLTRTQVFSKPCLLGCLKILIPRQVHREFRELSLSGGDREGEEEGEGEREHTLVLYSNFGSDT